MQLYVCYGTFKAPGPGGHPCRNAYLALRGAGYEPEVKRVYGWGKLPAALNPTRRELRKLSGQNWVPVMVDDDGETVNGTKAIVDWAAAHPAAGRE